MFIGTGPPCPRKSGRPPHHGICRGLVRECRRVPVLNVWPFLPRAMAGEARPPLRERRREAAGKRVAAAWPATRGVRPLSPNAGAGVNAPPRHQRSRDVAGNGSQLRRYGYLCWLSARRGGRRNRKWCAASARQNYLATPNAQRTHNHMAIGRRRSFFQPAAQGWWAAKVRGAHARCVVVYRCGEAAQVAEGPVRACR